MIGYSRTGYIGNSALSPTAGDIGGAWIAFTPTLSGLFTDGDWAKTCYYTKIGKTVIARYFLKSTDATPMGGAGSITLSLPVTAKTLGVTASAIPCGNCYFVDASPAGVYPGMALLLESDLSTIILRSSNASGTYTVSTLSYSSTIPFTWTTNDEISVQIVYESA